MGLKKPEPPSKSWYIAQWPTLAWIETVIKLVGLIIGTVVGIRAITSGTFQSPTGSTWAQFILLGLLSLGLLAAIYDRILEREIIAMGFVILNNLGHWGMTLSLLSIPKPSQALLAFSLLMLTGDVVKLIFLKVYDFKVRDTPRMVMYTLTGFYATGYLIIALIEWIS